MGLRCSDFRDLNVCTLNNNGSWISIQLSKCPCFRVVPFISVQLLYLNSQLWYDISYIHTICKHVVR